MKTVEYADATRKDSASNLPFYLTLLYLALEYGRPQAILPGMGSLHLPAIIVIFLMVMLIGAGELRLSELQTKLFFALLLLMTIHIPLAQNNYWAFEYTRSMLITFVVYLAIVRFVNSFRKFRIMITVWLCIHLYLAITGVISGGEGTGGFVLDTNDFALVLNMIIPISLFAAFGQKSSLKRSVFLILSGIFLVLNMITFSRGGFAGLAAVGLYFWIRSPRKVLSILLLFLVIYSVLNFAPETYLQRISTITDAANNPDDTGYGRIHLWKAAWKMFLDYPILGVGPRNYNSYVPAYWELDDSEARMPGGSPCHSLYFTLLAELGITGTILFVWMLFSSLMDLNFVRNTVRDQLYEPPEELDGFRQTTTYMSLSLEGSLVGFLISGTFISVFYYPCFWIWMAMVASLKNVVAPGEISYLQ